MERVIHLIYGNQPFVLETRSLRRVKKTKGEIMKNSPEKIRAYALKNAIAYEGVARTGAQKRMGFERGIFPDDFSIEREGFYLARVSDAPGIRESFEKRGFKLSEESITLENSFLQ